MGTKKYVDKINKRKPLFRGIFVMFKNNKACGTMKEE